ncbi:MAG: AraC family transcriptional regulator [Ferruginibacter sp.]
MIKPFFESINSQNDNSFAVRLFEQEAFTSPYHYHPEFELTLIDKGTGKRYIGDHMDHFSNGDLAFLGPNLPHCWKTEDYVKGEINASSIVIQFTSDFLGHDFFSKPELSEIHKLLERSQGGIIYDRSIVPEISRDIKNIAKEEVNFKRLHLFLDVLHKLSITSDFTLLNRLNYIPIKSGSDLERINKVFAYIIDNYKTTVSLDEVAQLACMTPNAFCKYFKKVTQKTFIEVVVEYRLHYATTQLLHTNKSVAQVSLDCGFNDIVHFIRMFKSKMQVSPLQYKKKFLKSFNLFDDSMHREEFLSDREAV